MLMKGDLKFSEVSERGRSCVTLEVQRYIFTVTYLIKLYIYIFFL